MLQLKPFHLCLADLGSAGVGTGVEFRLHFQPFGRGGVGDQVDDDLMAHQRLTAPVLRDVTEEPMLDLVPFARSRRKVADAQTQSRSVRQLLQSNLPQPAAATVAPTAIGRDQQFARSGVTLANPSSATSAGSLRRRTLPCRDQCRRSPIPRCGSSRRRRTGLPCPSAGS